MTVFCLVELDNGAGEGGLAGVADESLRAITLARGLAAAVPASASASAAGASGAPGGLAAVVFGGPSGSAPGSDGPGSDVGSGLIADLAAYGVTDVYAVSGIDGYAPLAWARVLQWLLSASANPGLHESDDQSAHQAPGHAVVAAGTERGNEVLAHLGAITGLPMAANCTGVVDNGDGSYAIVRQRWAGLLLEEALLAAPAALLTVATDAVPAAAAEAGATATVHDVSPSVDGGDLVVRAVETPAGSGGASLATARVVVGGGRGVGSADGFASLEELAALLGGVVGVSRVVTSEGWRPHTQQVGQTGTKITPDLYLACGISGAIQHFAGCSGAKNIIAINTDPGAPMMTRADYAVIGNLHEVVPALVTALTERTAPNS
ncbi:MAG: electron transfer flavoprotein subunit alpha/FixB family protein [Trebonia sp.]|jgi:electron transfer flavoprotein alpha subunit